MANPTHTRLAQVARRLIAKNGRLVELLSVAEASDGVSDTNPFGDLTDEIKPEPSVTVVASVKAVQKRYATDEIDGVQIQSKDVQFLLDSQFVPSPEMRLRDRGLDYSIVSVIAVEPGDVICLYKVQVRL